MAKGYLGEFEELILTMVAVLREDAYGAIIAEEIGVRQKREVNLSAVHVVLGASGFQIITMLSASFTKLVVISFILVSPLTYYLLSKWLENFSYRITVNPWQFLLGGLIAIIIALITISYHTIQSARQNPVNSLHYE